MHFPTATGDSRLLRWLRVREFAVPPSMIDSATARRAVGDWAGACAAARVDVDCDLRAVARGRGRQVAAEIRADLRHLAPDLLRWHLPRVSPLGLLRPGLTLSLARYRPSDQDDAGTVHLVVRTPPAWADAGQRFSLAVFDGSRCRPVAHPHPHPDPRFRLDLHRHLWDARRAGELRQRSGADRRPGAFGSDAGGSDAGWAGAGRVGVCRPDGASAAALPVEGGYAVDRWTDEAALLLRAQGRLAGPVVVRLGARRRLLLDVAGAAGSPSSTVTVSARTRAIAAPVLPDAATWSVPDLELLRAGLIGPDRLHPLVAPALIPDRPADDAPDRLVDVAPDRRRERPSADGSRFGPDGAAHLVDCRGARHRIALVDGVLAVLDHDPVEMRREELLVALGGPALPCLRAIDEANRHPECLVEVRARLDHGDTAGAFAAVEALLGPDAVLRSGALRDLLQTAARRRVDHGLFRAGLTERRRAPGTREPRSREFRGHPRHAAVR